MSSAETINSKRLFVGNLSFGTNWRTLKDHFKSVGNATFASIITDPATKRSRGCGIVEMETVEQAKEAIKTLNETELEGRKIFVREDQRSKEKQQPNNEVKQVEVKKDQPATTAQAPKDVKVKEPKQPKEPKVPKDPKEPKEPKQPKEKKPKQPKEQTESKDVKAENGESSEAKQPKQPKEKKPKVPKQPKAEGSAEASSDQPKTVVAPKVEHAKTETSAPATTTEGSEQPKEKKPKKKRSKKPKTEGTENKTAESSEVKPVASGEASEKKEDDDGFREVRKRERRGRGALAVRGSRGGRGAARGGVARRPRTEGSASNSPSTEEKTERKPKTPDTSKSSGKSIFVSNLPKTTSGEDVAKLFDAAGKVVKAELKVDAKGQPRGLAQVLFETAEAATKAIETVNGTELEGRKLNVRLDYFA